MMNKKSVAILIVIVLVIIGVIFFAGDKSTVSEIEQITTVKYDSSAFGISIEHPSNWVVREFKNDMTVGPKIEGASERAKNSYAGPHNEDGTTESITYVQIRLEDSSLDKVRAGLQRHVGGWNAVEKETTIGGIKAYSYTEPQTKEEIEYNGAFYEVVFENNGRVYNIYTNEYDTPEVKKIFDSISFINPITTN